MEHLLTHEAGRQQWEFGKWASTLMGGWSSQLYLEPPAAGVRGGGMRHDGGGGRTRSYTSTCLVSIYLFFPYVFFMIQFPPFVRTLTSPHRRITAALVYLPGGSACCSRSACFQSTSCLTCLSVILLPELVPSCLLSEYKPPRKQTSLSYHKGS